VLKKEMKKMIKIPLFKKCSGIANWKQKGYKVKAQKVSQALGMRFTVVPLQVRRSPEFINEDAS
jgi:hypothetical protein